MESLKRQNFISHAGGIKFEKRYGLMQKNFI